MFTFLSLLIASCGNKNIYKQYVIEQTSIDSTKVLNSLEVRAFYYNYNVCESDLSSILISKRKKLNDEWKNHIEQ
jgi:hypothetical protein